MDSQFPTSGGFTGALRGLKVIDLGHAVAGPLCAALLADHGADVIKVEPPEGDHARHVGPFPSPESRAEFGAVFQYANRNKKGIALDLKAAAGVEVFLRLVAGADVLIENFRAGVMERLGLGYEALAALNPRLVYTSIRGYGDPRNGRTLYTDWPAVDIVGQAMGGLMSVTGPTPESPMLSGAVPGDTLPGMYAAFATLAAVIEARASGRGQYVDVSMVDTVVAMNEPVVTSYSISGVPPAPMGSRLSNIVPFGRIRVKDGWAVLAVPPGRHWATFCRLIGQPELAVDPRFSTDAARAGNADAVYEIVERFTGERTADELLALFGGHIPFAPVFDAQRISRDPYFRVREMLTAVEHPGAPDPVVLAGVPAKLSRTPGGIRRGAPRFGEHTAEVLEALGYTPAEAATMLAAGAALSRRDG